jgi:hypothetical protein
MILKAFFNNIRGVAWLSDTLHHSYSFKPEYNSLLKVFEWDDKVSVRVLGGRIITISRKWLSSTFKYPDIAIDTLISILSSNGIKYSRASPQIVFELLTDGTSVNLIRSWEMAKISEKRFTYVHTWTYLGDIIYNHPVNLPLRDDLILLACRYQYYFNNKVITRHPKIYDAHPHWGEKYLKELVVDKSAINEWHILVPSQFAKKFFNVQLFSEMLTTVKLGITCFDDTTTYFNIFGGRVWFYSANMVRDFALEFDIPQDEYLDGVEERSTFYGPCSFSFIKGTYKETFLECILNQGNALVAYHLERASLIRILPKYMTFPQLEWVQKVTHGLPFKAETLEQKEFQTLFDKHYGDYVTDIVDSSKQIYDYKIRDVPNGLFPVKTSKFNVKDPNDAVNRIAVAWNESSNFLLTREF